MRTVRPLMTRATTSMTVNVRTDSWSATTKVRYGGTKKKSKDATLAAEATTAGPRPHRLATITMPSRYVMIRLAGFTWGNISHDTPVAAATTTTACAYPLASIAEATGA